MKKSNEKFKTFNMCLGDKRSDGELVSNRGYWLGSRIKSRIGLSE